MNKKVLFFLAIFILILSFFANFYLSKTGKRSRASEGEKVKVIFNPSSLSGQPNSQFPQVKIQGQPINSSNNPISMIIRGYRFNLNFDKNLLELVSLTYPSFCPEVSGVSSTIQDANNSGLIKVACANLTSSGYTMVSNSFSDLLTIVFKAKSTNGSTNLFIDKNVASSGFSKINQDGILTIIPFAESSSFSLSMIIGSSITTNSTPSPDSVNLNIKLKFQGITRNPAASDTMDVRVKLGGTQSTEYKTATFTVDDNGVWSGSVSFNTAPGSGYIVYIKGPKHIQKKVCVNNPSESYPGSYRCAVGEITLNAGVNDLDFSRIFMLAGDLPQQDGVVNSYV